MMHHIRPWQLFQHLGDERRVAYEIPRHKGTESLTIMALDTLILVAAARIAKVKTILELGTAMGYNALHLAMNLDASIVTVEREKIDFVFNPTGWDILPVTADLFDYQPAPFDMVFCDINYTPQTFQKEIDLAFACQPKVIGWHDYGHPFTPHVKTMLDGLSETRDLYHIEDSWTVLWFRDGLAI